MFEPLQVGRYHCFELVAEGPSSQILKARLAGAMGQKLFLVRRLCGPLAEDPAARRRLLTAATALMPLDDPRLLAVVEARDIPGGDCFVASEWVHAVTLDRLTRSRLSEDAAAYLGREAARALAALVARKRVHGALEPCNVLVTPEGDVKVCDAGLRLALSGRAADPAADPVAVAGLIDAVLGARPKRRTLLDAVRSPTVEAFQAAGDATKGKAELALAARKVLEDDRMVAEPAEPQRTMTEPLAKPALALPLDLPAPKTEAPRRKSEPLSAVRPEKHDEVIEVPRNFNWLIPVGATAALAIAGVAGFLLLRPRLQAAPEPPPAPKPVAVAPAPAKPPAPPPPEPPAPPSELTITSEPSGASVYIDRQPSGITPARVQLSPGRHKVVLLLEGARLGRATVEWPPSEPTLAVKLEMPGLRRGAAGLKVRCKTSDLPVFVDGINTGKRCTSERIDLQPGEHHVGIYVPATDQLDERVQALRAQNHSTRMRFRD